MKSLFLTIILGLTVNASAKSSDVGKYCGRLVKESYSDGSEGGVALVDTNVMMTYQLLVEETAEITANTPANILTRYQAEVLATLKLDSSYCVIGIEESRIIGRFPELKIRNWVLLAN